MHRLLFIAVLTCLGIVVSVSHADPTTQPAGKLAHLLVDARQRQVRVDCEAVKADYPLEFMAVVTNTNEYEALVRSEVKPSDLHLALLIIGLKPGQCVHRATGGDLVRVSKGREAAEGAGLPLDA